MMNEKVSSVSDFSELMNGTVVRLCFIGEAMLSTWNIQSVALTLIFMYNMNFFVQPSSSEYGSGEIEAEKAFVSQGRLDHPENFSLNIYNSGLMYKASS